MGYGPYDDDDMEEYLGEDEFLVFQASIKTTQEERREKYQKYVLSYISAFRKVSKKMYKSHTRLQLAILLSAATVTVALSIPEIPKFIPLIISGIVTVAT